MQKLTSCECVILLNEDAGLRFEVRKEGRGGVCVWGGGPRKQQKKEPVKLEKMWLFYAQLLH